MRYAGLEEAQARIKFIFLLSSSDLRASDSS